MDRQDSAPTHSTLAKVAFGLSTAGAIAVLIGVVTLPLVHPLIEEEAPEPSLLRTLGLAIDATGALWGLCLVAGGVCALIALLQKGRRKLLSALAIAPVGLGMLGIVVRLISSSGKHPEAAAPVHPSISGDAPPAAPVPSAPSVATAASRYPVLAPGMTCEEAQAEYAKAGATPDATEGAFGSILGIGSYLNACGLPSNVAIEVCAAIQNGRAVGVTVRLTPPRPPIASCVTGQVRSLAFPSHPRLDISKVAFPAR
jgi:hypothetical protein